MIPAMASNPKPSPPASVPAGVVVEERLSLVRPEAGMAVDPDLGAADVVGAAAAVAG